ncbi:MAG: hypothetical protein AAF662_16795 [Pseudomonadota bacterium]
MIARTNVDVYVDVDEKRNRLSRHRELDYHGAAHYTQDSMGENSSSARCVDCDAFRREIQSL